MYTTSKEMFLPPSAAVMPFLAFNFENMEMLQAILAAAEELAARFCCKLPPPRSNT